ncbi:hypothetical protein [Reyranella sp.]|uniref:hypothetical protein n=1 Tax=Reyranella sp. TaxID=1929291 RepID=UPI003783CDB8
MLRTTLATLALIAAAGVAYAQTTPTTPTIPTAPDTRTMPGGTGTSPGMTTPGTTKAAPTTASSAKAAIEAKGYTGVKSLSRDAAGNWSAKAVKNNQEVAVLLDATGNIKEQ